MKKWIGALLALTLLSAGCSSDDEPCDRACCVRIGMENDLSRSEAADACAAFHQHGLTNR